MKKLLLSFLLLSPFAFSDSKQIKVIDYDADTKITVYCISGYAFTQYDKTALVQMMKERWSSTRGTVTVPYECSQYLEYIRKINATG
jgi:hypothetical protein